MSAKTDVNALNAHMAIAPPAIFPTLRARLAHPARLASKLLLSATGLILLRTLQVFHFEAVLHEKAVLRKILLIESFVLHCPGHLKGIIIKLAGWRLVFKRGHFKDHAKRGGTLDLQYIDQLGCRLDGRPLQYHHRGRRILPIRK